MASFTDYGMPQAPRPPTPKQLNFLASLGYTGPQPSTCKAASDAISTMLHKSPSTHRMPEDLRTLRERCSALTRSCAEQQAELSNVRAQLQTTREALARIRNRYKAVQGELADLNGQYDACLKKILSIAHPDKWSQGQPATQLAHEMAIILNDLRLRRQQGSRA